MASQSAQPSQTADRSVEQVVHQSSELLQGKIPNSDTALGHPIHPSTVHWPIAVSDSYIPLESLIFYLKC